MNSHAGLVARWLARDVIGSFFWFPVWWYTHGLIGVARWVRRTIAGEIQSLGFGIWIRNLFVPMYGQRDIAGRLISVFMRIVVLIGRGLMLGILSLASMAALILWIMVPPFILVFGLTNLFQGIYATPVSL